MPIEVMFEEEELEVIPEEIQQVLDRSITENFNLKAQSDAIELRVKEIKASIDQIMKSFHLKSVVNPSLGGYSRQFTGRNTIDQEKLRANLLKKGMSAVDVQTVLNESVKHSEYWSVTFRLPQKESK